MPVEFLTEAERARLQSFPQEIPGRDLRLHFGLSDKDLVEVHRQRGETNRLGFALHLCALRYLGFLPTTIEEAPEMVVTYLARQLGVAPELASYGARGPTRVTHRKRVVAYLGFRRMGEREAADLREWLLERALEHDTPQVLLGMACEWLHREEVVRPKLTRLERLVAEVRNRAEDEILRRLAPELTGSRRAFLDQMLVNDEELGCTGLAWLRSAPGSNRPDDIRVVLEKLARLKGAEVEAWDLSAVPPNRLRVFARVGGRTKPRDLRELKPRRRYPALLAFLHQLHAEITDEVLEMFVSCFEEVYSRARRDFDDHWRGLRESTNQKLGWFRDIGRILLNQRITNRRVRDTVFRKVSRSQLTQAVEEADEIVRPQGDAPYDFFARSYGYLRRFLPRFLELMEFKGSPQQSSLLSALALLRELDASGSRRPVPANAPSSFVDDTWHHHVFEEDGSVRRRYYELCAFSVLSEELGKANVWVPSSRRHAALESYLIPRDQWEAKRTEVCQMLSAPEDGTARLEERTREMETRLARLDRQLATGESDVRIENGRLVLPRLSAEERPESATRLEDMVADLLPRVELPDLLIEVDRWTGFSDRFQHASGSTRRPRDFLKVLYASILAHACNFGLHQMASVTDISYSRLDWCTTWFLRDECLRKALAVLVDHHHSLPLARIWGGGILSSSDGQRFPAAKGVRQAKANPRYFGYGKGLTLYSWTSDQFSQFGSKVIPTTARDATYVLDEILDNETELDILEHTSDTAGYTEIVFALFDLLGLRFAPRIRDLKRQQLYRLDSVDLRRYPRLRRRFAGVVRAEDIVRNWDELMRVAGSLKKGWVTASLLVQKLQRYPKRNAYVRALHGYGRVSKTLHVLEWYADPILRRRVGLMLNKGEALHALRDVIRHANKGYFRRPHAEALLNEAACLNLVVNAVIIWNTKYMKRAIDHLRGRGYTVRDEDIALLWPTRHEHINVHGKLTFDVDRIPGRDEYRPLRVQESALNQPPLP